ncbi:MAG: TIGR03088 family PEP-CTERM/XrtA system glycosyltransferase [Pseudomonadota bacterium]
MSAPLIAHVIFRLQVGGLENGLANLIDRIPDSRYRHAIISLTDTTDFRERIRGGVPIIALNKSPGHDIKVFARMWKVLRELRPDVVHTRNLAALEMQVPAALAGVGARVHGEHGWDIFDPDGQNRKYQLLRRGLSPFVHRFVPLSRHLHGYLRDRVGIPKSKLRQIYNGVDTERFAPSGASPRSKVFPNWPTDAVIIGTVGRMETVKDQPTLARSFIRLRERSPQARAKARLVLLGDGALRGEVERVLSEGDALEAAWLPGSRDDVASLLPGFDIFVLPSLAEGISNTVLEAMSCGLPTVVTEVGGNPELVGADHGRLVKAGDVESMSEALALYVQDANQRREHGQQARRKIETNFSIDTMVESYLSVYDEVLNRV